MLVNFIEEVKNKNETNKESPRGSKMLTMGESFLKRFSYKFTGSIFINLIGMIILIMTTRALGPKEFGQLEYVNRISNSLITFFMFNSSGGFFAWVSRAPQRSDHFQSLLKLIGYGAFLLFFFSVMFLISYKLDFHDLVLPGVKLELILLGMLFSFGNICLTSVTNLYDGIGRSSIVEKLKVLSAIIKLTLMGFIFYVGFFSINSWLLISCLTTFLTSIYLVNNLIKMDNTFKEESHSGEEDFNSFIVDYSRPFIIASILSFSYSFFETWYLQIVGGSTEQASFGIASKIVLIAVVFFSSFTPVIARDFGFYYGKKDLGNLLYSFEKVRFVYILACFVGVGLAFNAGRVVELIGGKNFLYAKNVLLLMSIYPLHQCLGQVSGQFLLVTGKSKTYVKISNCTIVAHFILIYLFITPSTYTVPGLDLGSVGIALMKTLSQIVYVNIQIYICCLTLGESFKKWLLFQVVPVMTLGVISFVISTIVTLFNFEVGLLSLIVFGIIYVVVTIVLVYYFPYLFNLKIEDKDVFLSLLNKKIKKRK